MTHWHNGKKYEEIPEKVRGSCDGCVFDKPGEVCYVHIWYDNKRVKVICGERPVIFQKANIKRRVSK